VDTAHQHRRRTAAEAVGVAYPTGTTSKQYLILATPRLSCYFLILAKH